MENGLKVCFCVFAGLLCIETVGEDDVEQRSGKVTLRKMALIYAGYFLYISSHFLQIFISVSLLNANVDRLESNFSTKMNRKMKILTANHNPRF